MAPFRLPRTCSVLVVEKEPLQALALEYVLEDIGCRAVGPVWQADDVLRSVRREAPNSPSWTATSRVISCPPSLA